MENAEPKVTEGQPETETSDTSAATESAQASGDSVEKEAKEDWWDVNSIKTVDDARKRIKDIQREYNNKAENLSKTTTKMSELEQKTSLYDDLQTKYNQLSQEVTKALQDENFYKKVRAEYLGQPQEDAPPKPEKMETMGDFINYLDKRDEYLANKMEKSYQTRLNQEISKIAQPVYKDRWTNALTKMREKFPQFAKYEAKVAGQIINGPYRDLYGKMDEGELLEKVFVATAYPELMESVKQDTLASIEKKKHATTSKAKTTTGGKPIGGTKEEIIARVREKLGE